MRINIAGWGLAFAAGSMAVTAYFGVPTDLVAVAGIIVAAVALGAAN